MIMTYTMIVALFTCSPATFTPTPHEVCFSHNNCEYAIGPIDTNKTHLTVTIVEDDHKLIDVRWTL